MRPVEARTLWSRIAIRSSVDAIVTILPPPVNPADPLGKNTTASFVMSVIKRVNSGGSVTVEIHAILMLVRDGQ